MFWRRWRSARWRRGSLGRRRRPRRRQQATSWSTSRPRRRRRTRCSAWWPPCRAMKLFMPQVQSRFFVVDQLLRLSPGTFNEAAPHMTRAAFVLLPAGSAGLLTFDSAQWPQKLAAGRGEISAAAHGADLAMGSPAACTAIAGGELDTFLKSPHLQAARASAGDSPLWGYIDVPALQTALAADDPANAAQIGAVMAMAGLERHALRRADRAGQGTGRRPDPDAEGRQGPDRRAGHAAAGLAADAGAGAGGRVGVGDARLGRRAQVARPGAADVGLRPAARPRQRGAADHGRRPWTSWRPSSAPARPPSCPRPARTACCPRATSRSWCT